MMLHELSIIYWLIEFAKAIWVYLAHFGSRFTFWGGVLPKQTNGSRLWYGSNFSLQPTKNLAPSFPSLSLPFMLVPDNWPNLSGDELILKTLFLCLVAYLIGFCWHGGLEGFLTLHSWWVILSCCLCWNNLTRSV